MDTTIVKPKDPGRVASGKKLVEWNRKKKEDMLKNQEPSQEPSQVPSQVPTSNNISMWYGGAAISLAGVGTVFYLYTRKKPSLTPLACDDDIFRMN